MHSQPIKPARRLSSIATFARRLSLLPVGLVPVLLLCGMDAPNSPAQTHGPSGAKAKRGANVFQQRCISCHNKQPGDTMPFGPPNLNGMFRGPQAITIKQVQEIVVQGKGAMPAWGTVLTHSEIDDLVAYLKTL